jgi:hypothetical protein
MVSDVELLFKVFLENKKDYIVDVVTAVCTNFP